MLIQKEQRLLLIRYRKYKKYDFIKEHNDISEREGSVWLLKTGRSVSPLKMAAVMDESRCLVLRESKADGGKYYWAELMNVYQGTPKIEMSYPKYYSKMLLSIDGDLSKLDGTWLQIGPIHLLPNGYENALLLLKNKKSAAETLNRTRSSTLYVYANEELVLDEINGGESIVRD